MEIHFTRESEARIADLARRQGKDPAPFASEALAEWLELQDWATSAGSKIEDGWQQSERGEIVDAAESRERLAARHAPPD